MNANIMVFVMYGILYESMFNMYRPFAVKFLERVGGTQMHISLFFALPGLVAAFVLLPGSLFLCRMRLKKNVTTVLFLCSRTLILALAFIPWMPAHVRPIVFVSVIAVMNLPEALAQTSLQSFLGAVFPGAVRARAIALRNQFGHMFILIVSLLTGMALSYLPRNEEQRMVFYQTFFVLAFCVGLAEIFVFRKFREDPLEQKEQEKPNLSDVKKALSHKPFRLFLCTTILFQFAWQAGWPLTSVYQIEVIHSTEIWFALYTVTGGLGAFFAAGFWNRTINKRGNPHTLVIAGLLMSLNMLFIAIAPNELTMALACLFGGFATIGLVTALLNGTLAATPDHNRIIYLGIYNTCTNLSLFLSPLFASALMTLFTVQQSLLIVVGLRLACTGALVIAARKTMRLD